MDRRASAQMTIMFPAQMEIDDGWACSMSRRGARGTRARRVPFVSSPSPALDARSSHAAGAEDNYVMAALVPGGFSCCGCRHPSWP